MRAENWHAAKAIMQGSRAEADRMRLTAIADCPVCLLPHDPEIHAATLRLHEWLRSRVLWDVHVPQRKKPKAKWGKGGSDTGALVGIK